MGTGIKIPQEWSVYIVLIACLYATFGCTDKTEETGNDPPKQLSIDNNVDTVIEELIDEQLGRVFPYVQFRTLSEHLADSDRLTDELYDLSDHDRERIEVELFLQLLLAQANDSRRGDIASGSGMMHDAYVEALTECAADSGIFNVADMMRPSEEDHPDVSEVEYRQFAESLGFTRDELLDVRQACSRYAASLPLLDDEVREDLMRRLREHYLNAVKSWLVENPSGMDLSWFKTE